MAPRRRCPTCGSRQWHKEPLSGLVACSEGHVLQNYRSETNEVDHNVGHVMNKRKLKSTARRKEQKSNANPRLYHGARARYHYFSCQQYLLRLQVETLMKIWNLPPEFEMICRDVWCLHLSLLRDPPPPEPYSYLQEQESSDRKSQGNLARESSKTSLRQDISEEGTVSLSTTGVDYEDPNESEKSSSEEDSEMEELLRQNSEISSSSDEDGADDTYLTPKRTRSDGQVKTKTTRVVESPASTWAVLMIALWQLRIPVMYRDMARIMESYELPYLDCIRLLPPSMVGHLTKHSIQALSPHHVPSTLSVHKLTARLAQRINTTYGVLTPECNAAPLLWRLTRFMGGTPTLYALAKHVAYILKLPLTLHCSLAPGLRRARKGDPEHHKYDNVPTEVALMATIIIVLKMTYGLDGKPRFPTIAGDPVLALPRADQWLLHLKKLDGLNAGTKDELFDSSNVLAVGDLSENLLDEYLSFCEQALLGQDNASDDIIAIHQFPCNRGRLGNRSDEVELPRLNAPAGALLADISEAKRLHPAEDYTIWNSRDVFGTLAEEYGAVLGRAAKWIRTGQEYLSGVVELYERRFVRWWEDEKRRENAENGGEEG